MTYAQRLIAVLAVAFTAAACAPNPYVTLDSKLTGKLDDETVLRHATGGALAVDTATVITGNDAAFQSKLAMVKGAKTSIDAMYFIFADDYSSSVLTEAMIAAAQRGVRVRLLLDYHTNYKNLDLFSMMEKQGGGNLHVRFYNRPTRNIIMDAAFMTLGCGDVELRAGQNCSKAKLAEIDARFAGETIDGTPAAASNISNLNEAGSGLFLSGLYGKNPYAMAVAVLSGQKPDLAKLSDGGTSATPEQKKQLLEVAKVYWRARTAPFFEQIYNRAKLFVYFAYAGDTLNPIYNSVSEYLPIERRNIGNSARDWEYITDYLHHKLLLVDNRALQLGGRNVEDSYHMRPNALTDKYVFMDTDARLSLSAGGGTIESSFDTLWNFRTMVATIAEIRHHAPNDIVANGEALGKAWDLCVSKEQLTVQEDCFDREFAARAHSLKEREAARLATLKKHVAVYRNEYRPANDNAAPSFDVDPGALVAYVENLPFDALDKIKQRHYGATGGREAQDGKKIHALWLAGLKNICKSASAKAEPQRVILHSAYFFPPSNLIRQFAHMINGDWDCSNVTITVLTNSIDTTDLNVVNIFARHTAKAFAEYYDKAADPKRGAVLAYYEYQVVPGAAKRSLHTKVSVLGGDMIVGSANADIRSYMMDSNNAIFIRNAPDLVGRYTRFIDSLLNDGTRVNNVTNYFLVTDRSQILAEDRETFRHELVEKYGVDQQLDAAQIDRLEGKLIELLDAAYGLVGKILAGDAAEKHQVDFDRTFKPI